MLELLDYEHNIRCHITLVGSTVCEDDIKERYGHTPASRESIETLHLDPGGFAFTDTEPIVFETSGVQVSVRPEHLYAIDTISTRMLPADKWVKVYMDYACVVLPVQTWAEILSVAHALEKIHENGMDLLTKRLAGLPHIKLD
jgi:hypothetical protein